MYNLLCCCPAVLLWLYYYCTTVLLYYCASVLLYERPGSDGQQHLPITKRLSWIPDSRDVETSHILQRVRSSCHNYFAFLRDQATSQPPRCNHCVPQQAQPSLKQHASVPSKKVKTCRRALHPEQLASQSPRSNACHNKKYPD